MRAWVLAAAVCLFLAGGSSAWAVEVEGVQVPEVLTAEGVELTLNGTGVRSKFFFDLYVGALYLHSAATSGSEVTAADQAMAIRLHILSKMITSEKMEEATREGFVKATNGDTSAIQDRIEDFISVFKKEEIAKGDVFDLVYVPKQGVVTVKNGERLSTVPGLDFKQALFGIWLGDDPVQGSLKEGMLGKE
jgi:hypothetical protein